MGELGVCRRQADSHVNPSAPIDRATLAALERFPALLQEYYSAIPTGFENWRPASWHGIPSEPFTPIEQLCHVRDIEIDGYHDRFARTRCDDAPVLVNIDGEALARERGYASADATKVLQEFRKARVQTLALIDTFSAAELDRRAVFDGATITLRGLVHMLCSHDQQHLSGMQWLLARIYAAA